MKRHDYCEILFCFIFTAGFEEQKDYLKKKENAHAKISSVHEAAAGSSFCLDSVIALFL